MTFPNPLTALSAESKGRKLISEDKMQQSVMDRTE